MSDRIVVKCPECSASLAAPAKAAGKRIRCPKCQGVTDVPDVLTSPNPAKRTPGNPRQPDNSTAPSRPKSQTLRSESERTDGRQPRDKSDQASDNRSRSGRRRSSVSGSDSRSGNRTPPRRSVAPDDFVDEDSFLDDFSSASDDDEFNPYSAPTMPPRQSARSGRKNQSGLERSHRSGNLPLASQWLRLANSIIDQIVIQVISFILGLVHGILILVNNSGVPTMPEQNGLFLFVSMLLGVLSFVGYYVVMEGLFQRTIGKLVTGTCVINTEGDPPRFAQILGRSFARMIPFEAFSFLSSNPAGWHDTLSGTRVVQSR
jgi:uncharacterized RDD family membrane protein YckC